jgi:serine/threonine protein kinase
MNEDLVKSVFLTCLRLDSPEQRENYLQETCDDALLQKNVRELLEVHDGNESFLEQPAAALAVTVAEKPASERIGTQVGPYKLREQIGEGGMGVVDVAEQTEPVRRKVALKIIKPGMDTKQVIARFEAERQTLALMDHPNIAKILDGGVTGGETGNAECGVKRIAIRPLRTPNSPLRIRTPVRTL